MVKSSTVIKVSTLIFTTKWQEEGNEGGAERKRWNKIDAVVQVRRGGERRKENRKERREACTSAFLSLLSLA